METEVALKDHVQILSLYKGETCFFEVLCWLWGRMASKSQPKGLQPVQTYSSLLYCFFHQPGKLPQQNPEALPQFRTKMNSNPVSRKWHGFDRNDPKKRCSQKNNLWKLMFERLEEHGSRVVRSLQGQLYSPQWIRDMLSYMYVCLRRCITLQIGLDIRGAMVKSIPRADILCIYLSGIESETRLIHAFRGTCTFAYAQIRM